MSALMFTGADELAFSLKLPQWATVSTSTNPGSVTSQESVLM